MNTIQKQQTSDAIELLQKDHHQMMIDNGFWEIPSEDGTLISLMHAELSEALEAIRNGNGHSDHIPDFLALEEEMADVVLRVLDFCEHHHLDLIGAILAKMRFNKTRPMKHGGKAF